MTAKVPRRGQKSKKKYAATNFSWLLIPPLLIRADFVFLHFVFLSFITETVSLKGESQSIIIWLNLISHHHLDEMDFLCNECAKSFAKEIDLVIHQARVHNKRSFSCEMCHVLIDNLDLLERLCFDRRSETHPYHVRHSINQLYSLLSLLHWEQSGQVWKADKQKGYLGEGEGRTGKSLLDSYEAFVQSGSKRKDLKDFILGFCCERQTVVQAKWSTVAIDDV